MAGHPATYRATAAAIAGLAALSGIAVTWALPQVPAGWDFLLVPVAALAAYLAARPSAAAPLADAPEAAAARQPGPLTEDQSRLAAILDTVVDAVITIDRSGRIESVNRATQRIFGYQPAELIGQNVKVLMPSPDRDRHDDYLRAYLTTGVARIIGIGREVVGQRKDGSVFAMELAVGHTQLADRHLFTGVVRDISQRKREQQRAEELRQQLVQSEKLRTVGTLAGGLAHDFNNLLTPILGYTDLLLTAFPAGSAQREDVETIRRAARRGRDLVAQLLAFSRPTVEQVGPVPVGASIAEAAKLIRPSLPPHIAILQGDIPDSLQILGDASRLQQVLVNLMTNAIDAMRPTGGRLTVTVETLEADREAVAELVHLVVGQRYGRIAIEDTGPGMSAEVRARIFEPFFTTKPVGKGTGLGLSVAYGIITGWGGDITVYSEPGKGTVFNIYLPIVTGTAGAGEIELPLEGSGHVLVVDDEEDVRLVAVRMLDRLGYTASTAPSADAALVQLETGEMRTPDIILTDQTMPGRPVQDLIRGARERLPHVPVLLMSGFDLRGSADGVSGVDGLIQKPLTLDNLSRALTAARLRGTDHP